MGTLDKSVRIAVAIIIALLYYFNILEGTLAYILMAVSIIFLITSFINFCPLYTLFGWNTCKRK
ncbi:DUF2892 domain-containing protein [Winogradskyella eximia]